MKNTKTLLIALMFITGYALNAQVAVNKDGSAADPSALLDVKSTDAGFLVPRMTQAQIAVIPSPANGLMVYNTDDCMFYTYRDCSGNWTEVALGTNTISPPFNCGDVLVDSRDGQSYATVQIGTQCWMAENLNIGTMINGSGNQTDNGTIEKYCYSDNTSNCDTYGGLYQWDEMMGYVTTEGAQGICPTDWHLPSDAEWIVLEEEVESTTGVTWNITGWRGTDAGGNLKESGTTHWNSPNAGATNSSGFTGLPGGWRATNGSFGNLPTNAFFWSSRSSENGSNAYSRFLVYTLAQVYRTSFSQAYGFSVRCIKD
jgi:uncharacterized protein (TIGR02145 family)